MTTVNKIETFVSKDEALNRVNNAPAFSPTKLFMLADVNADEYGMAWAVQDRRGRLLRESGVLC